MAMNIAEWRARIRERIRQHYPPGHRFDAKTEQRLSDILDFPVPSDQDLVAMQAHGDLPSDDELLSDGYR